jgi:hypothetical protein
LDPARFVAQQQMHTIGALGSSVSIAEANGCASSGHCSSLTQSGVPQCLQ